MKRRRRYLQSQVKRSCSSRPVVESEFNFLKNIWVPLLQAKLTEAKKRLAEFGLHEK